MAQQPSQEQLVAAKASAWRKVARSAVHEADRIDPDGRRHVLLDITGLEDLYMLTPEQMVADIKALRPLLQKQIDAYGQVSQKLGQVTDQLATANRTVATLTDQSAEKEQQLADANQRVADLQTKLDKTESQLNTVLTAGDELQKIIDANEPQGDVNGLEFDPTGTTTTMAVKPAGV